MPIEFFHTGDRVTPFSRIDLDSHKYQADFHDALETMDVELEDAVLVIRGKHEGRDVEFQVGNLKTTGPDNGMVIIHRAEYVDLHSGYSASPVATYTSFDEHRILLDCALDLDEKGHAFRIQIHEEQK